MNYLGRGWASCVNGLRDYHRSVLRTLLIARTDADRWRARAQLQHLLFDLEVDVAARADERGAERMTDVEKAVFHPALLRLRAMLGTLSLSSAPAVWAPTLSAALPTLHDALRRLRDWKVSERPATAGCTSRTGG